MYIDTVMHNRFKESRKNKLNIEGFTFVEISIAVAVISVVVGLAVAGLSTSKSDTQSRKRSATITSIEQAKNRYYLSSPENLLGVPTQLEHIAPYLTAEGETPSTLFDLVEGTGKPANDLELGSYQMQPAHFKSELGESGENTVSDPNTPPFDVNDPNAGYAALQQLAGMSPSDPEYQEILDLLNEAVDNGTISDSDFADAGLTEYNGVWMGNQAAQDAAALNAQNLLTSGGNWSSLSPLEQSSYANAFPQQAVAYGGASALNAMNPSNITPEIVGSYANYNGTWQSPYIQSGSLNSSTLFGGGSWGGWNSSFPIIRINNTTQQAENIGSVVPIATTLYGSLASYRYSINLNTGIQGITVSGNNTSNANVSGGDIRVIKGF